MKDFIKAYFYNLADMVSLYTAVSMLYSDKQISKSNKVLAKQGFRISINVQ